MDGVAEDAENQKQKHSGGSQKNERNMAAKDYKAGDCQQRKREKNSAAQPVLAEAKQQRITAEADSTYAECVVLGCDRPGA